MRYLILTILVLAGCGEMVQAPGAPEIQCAQGYLIPTVTTMPDGSRIVTLTHEGRIEAIIVLPPLKKGPE